MKILDQRERERERERESERERAREREISCKGMNRVERQFPVLTLLLIDFDVIDVSLYLSPDGDWLHLRLTQHDLFEVQYEF